MMIKQAKQKELLNFTRDGLTEWMVAHGLEPYRCRQIMKWVYMRQVDDFDQMTDLSKNIRGELASCFRISRLNTEKIETSSDGSKKFLFRLEDGKSVESVLIPEKNHYTLCISSQVGCAQGCAFCLTGKNGLKRNLTMAEMVSQVRDIIRYSEGPHRISNLVFMGMGEPLNNYQNLLNALTVITDNDFGLKFSNRRVTVSTSGVVPAMLNLGKDTRVNLAVSLNAVDNETRNRIMPVNRKFPMEKLLDACRKYPLPPGRRITFEYVLLAGINDSPADAERLTKLLRPIRSKINLIPFNEFEGSGFRRPEKSTIDGFQEVLIRKNFTSVVRNSKGRDISAACGQLSAKKP